MGEPKKRLQCPSAACGSFNYESTGQGTFCVECGAVIEESSFDLSVSFTDNQDGSRSMNGQFLSNMCTTPYRFAGSGGGGFSRESREVTIANGKKRIQQLAAALKLNHLVEAAHRLFLTAVQRNFVHGRKTANVVAACLYVICRQRNAPHLLIDFSDVLQTNVYVLGNCFLKFRRLLNLELPAIDPVHYIDRFAAKLEFGLKTHDVSKTAHKLVARMKRDWIQTGRRPSGLCGAALIMSARMHGFNRTQREMVNVMKICEDTLRKRLIEFEHTPAASLTVEQFLSNDVALPESDPPSFLRNRDLEQKLLDRETAAEQLAIEGDQGEEGQQLALIAAGGGKPYKDKDGLIRLPDGTLPLGKQQKRLAERAYAQDELYKELERELAESLALLEEQERQDAADGKAADGAALTIPQIAAAARDGVELPKAALAIDPDEDECEDGTGARGANAKDLDEEEAEEEDDDDEQEEDDEPIRPTRRSTRSTSKSPMPPPPDKAPPAATKGRAAKAASSSSSSSSSTAVVATTAAAAAAAAATTTPTTTTATATATATEPATSTSTAIVSVTTPAATPARKKRKVADLTSLEANQLTERAKAIPLCEYDKSEQEFVKEGTNELLMTTNEKDDDEAFDGELGDLILTGEESRLKKIMWQVQNKAFLDKERQDRLDGKVKRKRKRKINVPKDNGPLPVGEELHKTVVEGLAASRKSKKINYEAWQQLFST